MNRKEIKMLQIRQNCFETNSSSTHSLVMCDNDEWKALENNEAFLVGSFAYDMEIVKKENLLESLDRWNKENWEKYCKETDLNHESNEDFAKAIINGFSDGSDDSLSYEYHTFDQFWNNCEMETYEDQYKTKDGTIIHAFGAFGFDG